MKNRLLTYFRIQLKRTAVLLPYVLLLGVLLLFCVSAFALATGEERDADPSRIRLKIGLTGNFQNKYMALAVEALDNYDYTRVSIDFVKGSEEELADRLDRGEISSYICLPEDFFEAIGRGEHHVVRYVISAEDSGISLALMRDVISSLSRVLLETENSIYGIQEFVRKNNPDQNMIDESNVLIKSYFSQIVLREKIYEIDEIGVGYGQSYGAYYLTALSVFFMMIWGSACAPLYAHDRASLQKALASAGIAHEKQLLCDWAAHLLLTLFGIAFSFALFFGSLSIASPEWFEAIMPQRPAAFFLSMLLPALLFSTVSFSFYELAGKTVGALLLQALFALLVGYLSGCFYPISVFPEAVRTIGSILPAGAAVGFLTGRGFSSCALLICYTLIFGTLAFLARKKRTAGDAG